MRKIKKPIFLIILIIVTIFVGIYGFSYAKYVSDSIWNYYLKSKGFYFSSDNLSTTISKNVDNLWDGRSINFNVKNNLNQTVITSYDINYQVTCTITGDAASHATCHMNGTESNTQEGVLTSSQICVNNTNDNVDVSALNKTDCELGGYEWSDQIAKKDHYFDIVLTDENYELSDVVVRVEAVSTSPYTKSLKGDFVLHKINNSEDKVAMNYKNYSNYDRLVVSNSYSSTKCVKITWDSSKLHIDSSNSNISSYVNDENGYIKEIKFNIGAKDSLSYIFYKTDFNAIYNVTEFILTETSDC